MRGSQALLARLQLVGRVLSRPGQMAKTAKVQVTRIVQHNITGKEIPKRKNYLVHDEEEGRMPGDIVRIEETRKLSKRKYFKLIEVIKEEPRLKDEVTGEIFTRYSVQYAKRDPKSAAQAAAGSSSVQSNSASSDNAADTQASAGSR